MTTSRNKRVERLAGAKRVEAWFESNSRFDLAAAGILTCDEKCCRLVCRGPEGDVVHYLDRVCFARGPELASMEWHSFVGGP